MARALKFGLYCLWSLVWCGLLLTVAAPAPTAVAFVDSIEDAYKWVQHSLHIAEQIGDGSGKRISDALARLSVSTSFSGTGGAENALDALSKGCDAYYGRRDADYINAWACEYSDESRHELMMLDNGPRCIFGDIVDFVVLGFRQDLREQGPRMHYSDVERLFLQGGKKLVSLFAKCAKCGRQCEATKCTLHVAGTPCVAWSSMGTRAYASGATVIAFFVWLSMRRQLQEPWVLHENVPAFAHELLQSVLGDMYLVYSCVVNASQVGQLAERPRRLTWLVHRTVISVTHFRPWDFTYATLFNRILRSSWKELFRQHTTFDKNNQKATKKSNRLASPSEIADEVRWAARRDISPLHGQDLEDDDDAVSQIPMQNTFSESEGFYKHLNGYIDGGHTDCVLSLSQNPAEMPTSNFGKSTLHTLIRNNHPMFSPAHQRWMVPREALASNTYAVYRHLSQHGETTSFMYQREAFSLPPRKRHCIFMQAGDGMSLPSIGVALLWALPHMASWTGTPGGSILLQTKPALRALKLVRNHSTESQKSADADDASEQAPPSKRQKGD